MGLPYVTRADVAKRYDLSGQGAINAINVLVSLGILQDAGFSLRGGRAYVAPEVVRVVSA